MHTRTYMIFNQKLNEIIETIIASWLFEWNSIQLKIYYYLFWFTLDFVCLHLHYIYINNEK